MLITATNIITMLTLATIYNWSVVEQAYLRINALRFPNNQTFESFDSVEFYIYGIYPIGLSVSNQIEYASALIA